MIRFARSSADALAEMRRAFPALVIFDLQQLAHRTTFATLAEMKKDSALATVPIGFASHVQSDVIMTRDAGMDEVMARSSFTMRLSDIIKDV